MDAKVTEAASNRFDLDRWRSIGLVICVGCLLSFILFLGARQWEAKRVGKDLERQADIMTVDMRHEVRSSLVALRAISSIYATSEIVDRMWVRTKVERILLGQHTIRAVAWAPKIADGGRGDYESAIRGRGGYGDFELREWDLQGQLVRAGRRATYFPVSESLPIGGASSEIPAGLDLTSDKALNDALQTAWKTGELVATPPVIIASEGARESRVAVFAPVHRPGTDEAGRQDPQNMMGMLVGIIRVKDLVEEVLKEWNGKGIEVSVYDVAAGEGRLLMAPEGSQSVAHGERPLAWGALKPNGLRSVTTMEIADRHWGLEFVGTDQYLAAARVWAGWEVLAMGLGFTVLLASYISTKMRQGAAVERLVLVRTAELNQANRQLTDEIRERERATEALRESETRFRGMADTAPVMIWLAGPDGRSIFYNKTLLEFTGRSREEELTDWLAGVHPDDRPLLENYWKAFTLREPFAVEYRQRRADGVYRWTLDRGTPRFLPDGAFAGYIGCGIDVTELKETQQMLQQTHDAALEASRLKSEFLANMSHEIRTPMNGILGMTDLTLRTQLSTEQRDYLTLVKTSGESLLEIINDILDFSKIEAGHLDLEQGPFLLRESVAATIKPLALRAHSKGLELSCHIAPEVPDALIGDSLRLRQIVVNLIGNAIKFTERGEVMLRIGLERETPAGVLTGSDGAPMICLHCAVIDTGVGIPAEKQQLIFQPFSQADGSTTRNYGGTGLGLTICSRLVKLMDGRIWVESEQGRGSEFHFTALFRVQDQDRARETGGTLTLEALAGLSVLTVDDNATSRTILQEWLTAWQMHPTMTAYGREALEILRQARANASPIDLCILDAGMPEIDGFSLAGEIMEQSEGRIPSILMLSSIDQPRDIARCRDLGVAAYVVKPVAPSELWNAMMMALGRGGVSAKAGVKLPQGTNSDGSSISSVGVRQCRILLAEDNPVNQMLAVRLLEKEGHSVSVAGNGLKALAALEQGTFDLILMDVQMPEMDGLEATAAIRRQEQAAGRHIPIVALTAHAMKGDRERCLAAGMDEYLTKPLRAEALFDVIAHFMAGSVDAATSESVSPPAGARQTVPLHVQPTPHRQPDPPMHEAPFDRAELFERVGRDVGLMRELVGLFLEEGPIHMTEIHETIDRGDASDLAKAAHALKGAVSVFGAKRSVEAALRLEQLGRAGDLVQAGDDVKALERAMAVLIPALEALMSEE